MVESKESKWLREYSNGRKELKENALKNNCLPDFASFDLEFWKKIYEEGKQAAATENAIQWHNIMENPKDLPKEKCTATDFDGNKVIPVLNQCGDKVFCHKEDKSFRTNIGACTYMTAWCEIPQFEGD